MTIYMRQHIWYGITLPDAEHHCVEYAMGIITNQFKQTAKNTAMVAVGTCMCLSTFANGPNIRPRK